jgi:hypothetical protein
MLISSDFVSHQSRLRSIPLSIEDLSSKFCDTRALILLIIIARRRIISTDSRGQQNPYKLRYKYPIHTLPNQVYHEQFRASQALIKIQGTPQNKSTGQLK